MGAGWLNSRSTAAFRAGPLRFRVESNDHGIVDVLDRLFVDLITTDESAPVARAFATGDQVVFGFERDNELPYQRRWFLEELVSLLNRRVLDLDADAPHIHAAGVALEDRGVIIAAHSETGKSTLTAHLLQRGWDYLTDEAVALTPSGAIRGFPKPLTMRPGGLTLVGGLDPAAVTLPERAERVHVPASAVGAGAVIERAVPRGCVVLQRGSVASPEVRLVGAGEMAIRLLEHMQDMPRLGLDAFLRLCRLTEQAVCAVVTIDGLAGVDSVLRDLIESERLEGPVRESVTTVPRASVAEQHGVVLGESVNAVMLRDQLLLFESATNSAVLVGTAEFLSHDSVVAELGAMGFELSRT